MDPLTPDRPETFGGYTWTLRGHDGLFRITVDMQTEGLAAVSFGIIDDGLVGERIRWLMPLTRTQAASVGRWLVLTCGEGGTH